MIIVRKKIPKGRIYAGLILIIGSIGSFVAWDWIRDAERVEIKSRFSSLGLAMSNKLFRVNLISVNDADVSNFVSVTQGVSLDRYSYGNFTDLSLSFGPGSDAETTWHPLVSPGNRQAFLSEYMEAYPDNELDLSEPGEPMWPTLYQFPGNDPRLGIDIYSDTRITESIEFMLDINDNVISKRIISPEGSVQVRSFQPVFDRGLIIGCVSKDIDVGVSIETAFENAFDLNNPRRSTDDELAYELIQFPGMKLRSYLIGSQVGQLMYASDGIEIIEGASEESSSDFINGDDEIYEFSGELDDATSLLFVIRGSIRVPKTVGLFTLIVLLSSTLFLSYTMYTWRRLLSHRKKALDIAIVQSEHKSKFVSEISHEFRTPLNGIMGMIDLLKTEDTSKTVRKYMGIAQSCSEIMLSLVNDILDFSKLQSGKMKIVRCPVDIRTFIQETMDIMRVTYRQKNEANKVFLRMDIDKTVPGGMSEIDNIRVRQVIVNLMSNALKFTKDGSVSVDVRCDEENVESGDMRIYVDVTDTGIGISEEGVSNLFKPFSQVHDAREVKAGGTGLGLVICKTLCETMDGEIVCKSVVGEGTTFSFNCVFGKPSIQMSCECKNSVWDLSEEIEIDDDEYIVDKASKPVIDPIGSCFTTRSVESSRPSIIVADDVNVNRLLFRRMLEQLGVEIHVVKDGSELVKTCSNRKFSLILTDIVMPILSGTQASRLIVNGSGPNKKTPIIAVGGSTSDETGMCVDSILKPVARNVLYDKMSKWLTDEEVTWIHQHWERSNE